MWPFDKPVANQTAIPEKAIEDAIDELGLVRMNGLHDAINSAMEKHFDPSNVSDLDDTGGHFGTEFNLRATVGRLKSLYSREPWVAATASLIARSMSTVNYIVRDQTTGEIDPDHPLNETINAGNKLNDGKSVNWAGYLDLALGGNYFRILSDDFKTVWHAPVEFTQININEAFRQGDMNADPIDTLLITGGTGSTGVATRQEIPWKNVIHHKFPNPYNPFFGLSMYTAASRPILLDRHKNEFEMAFYLRGATHSGVIETSEDLTKQRMERLMRTFEQTYTGKRNWWRTLWLPKNSHWVTNGLTMSEMQHLEGLRENRKTLLAVLGVPGAMVGIVEDVNRATAEIQEAVFWNNTIIPMSWFIASGWNNSHLVKNVFGGAVQVEPDFTGIRAVEGSFISKGEDIKATQDVLVINELRTDILGYPPLKPTDPRGNMFVAEVRTSSALGSMFAAPPEMGPEEDSPEPEGLSIEIAEGTTETAKHPHTGLVDESGNGKTTEDDTGHEHELTGEPQEDASILVVVGPGTSDGHTHPSVTMPSEKSIEVAVSKQAKRDASVDQDRLERIQSEKYLKQYRRHTDLLLEQTEQGLAKGVNISTHLTTLLPDRIADYNKTALPVLVETMERGFVVAAANSKFFSKSRTKAPKFTPVDEQALEVIKEQTREGKIRTLQTRSQQRFLGFDENETLQIEKLVEQGLEQGNTFQQIAKTIEKDFGENYGDQAFTITRTEVLTAVSDGLIWEQEALEQVFSEVEKQWFHIGDTASNPEARSHHLTFEKKGKKPTNFIYVSDKTGNSLKYPRDPTGGAIEVINCRCTMVNTVATGATSNATSIVEGS